MARVLEKLEGRKKEIWEMATLMADEENPTDREIAVNLVHARQLVDGISDVLKMATGEKPWPKRDPNWLQKLKEEVERGDFEYDEEN